MMDGNNGHGYIQEDNSYDELMNGTGWSGPDDHFLYTQQPQDDLYSRFGATQPAFDQYNVPPQQQQQPTYPSIPYSNSPYAAQYQHARPSDVFGQTGNTHVDPSLQGSGQFQPLDRSFSAAPNTTISPQYLQYGIPTNQPTNRAASADFNRSANTMSPNNFNHQQQAPPGLYFNNASQNINVQRPLSNLIPYPALPVDQQNDSRPGIKRNMDGEPPLKAARVQQQREIIPPNPLRITHPELLAKRSSSSRPQMPYAPFVYFENESVQVPLGLKNTLPKFHPRKPRSGRELVPGFDISRSSAPARTIKKDRASQEKHASKWKGTSQGPKSANKLSSLREERGVRSTSNTPTTTETSSSEGESSSDEESEYEEDSMPLKDVSEIRGAQRPTNVVEATFYDATGIVWRDPRYSPYPAEVKTAIEKYGNFVIALRTQLKDNASDITAQPANANNLTQARAVLLEQLYQAIDAANKNGFKPVVENLGGHQRLVNGLTTTLIECIKSDDYLGKLPRAVFALLAKFETMSDDLLKRLKFDSIQKRWSKKNDKTINENIASILKNTTDAKKRAEKEKVKAEESKKILEKIELAKQRTVDANKGASANPGKRPHDGDGTNGKPTKKFASDASGTPSSKPISKRNNLLGISSKPAPKPVARKRDVSPPQESKLGALLASIAKPPEPPRAPEAPPRAPETPEEKARRERKESRRHLRVKFKEGAELALIKIFKHEQAEDEGRQDDMLVRDAHDDRSEGMMHKRRVSETLDEDDDNQGEWEDKPYPELIPIDFSGVEKNTTFGPKYVTRGGDLTFTTPEQQLQERREALELMAIYTDPDDIPTSPKEPPPAPSQTDGAEDIPKERQLQPPTTPWLAQRLQEIEHHGPYQAHQISMRRLEAENRARGVGHAFSNSPSPNINSILQQLGGPNQSLQQQAESHNQNTRQAMDSQALENLESIVNSLKGKPYPANEPPDWMTNEGQRAAWWNGYKRDNAGKEIRQPDQVDNDRFQPPPVLPAQPLQQMPTQPYQPPPPNMSAAAPMFDMNQMQAAYASYASGGNGLVQQQYDYQQWVDAAAAAQAQAQAYTPQPEPPRRYDDWNESQPPKSNKGFKAKQRGYDMKEFNADPPRNTAIFDENGEYKGKKKPCRFFQEGKCAKGAKCTYLHD
ncbi:hypothetical protein LHYA1_G001044 [Lachnellula hyalina]|uniref:C3H1-type domain-containing protein n=1 Tax=Lachnellula hyalina TaxID=1316788 RepID=A0A8H8R6R0_9HELO|nr:uncharacterized protein LHYA1_G001044 [Lachnellula hyalina]TVY29613.1 hypothetical protein LHYA1_G001044 [Lachnellula hyalina]